MDRTKVHTNENIDSGSPQATSLLSTEGKVRSREHGRLAKSKMSPNFLSSWPLEISAAVLSIACIVGMVALLTALDGKPYIPWTMFNTSITPNSLLSILSTFSKSALLLAVAEGLGQLKWIYFDQKSHPLIDLQTFDEASRGPFGALKLLWDINFRASAASLGAIITVLALALDPFTQQILSFPTKMSILNNSTASIKAVQIQEIYQRFNGTLGAAIDTGSPTSPFRAAVDSAILTGTLKAQNPTSFNCPTGNCFWPAYSTLGVCSQCVDVSQELVVKCEKSYPGLDNGEKSKICVYEFPKVYGYRKETNFNPAVIWSYVDSYLTSTPSMNISITIPMWAFKNVSTSIVIIESFKVPTWTFNVSDTEFERLETSIIAEAQRCNLTWCEKTYKSTTCDNGILHDAPTFSRDLVFSTRCHNVTSVDPTCPGWPFDIPDPSSTDLDWSNREQSNKTYWVSIAATQIIQDALLSTFGVQDISTEQDFGFAVLPALATQIYDNFLSTWDNIAVSMTNRLRDTNSSRVIQGKVNYPIAHVHVNYGWFVYPAAIALLAAVFLIISIIFSNECNGVIWKSSVLPLLLCSPMGYERREQMNRLRDLEEEAKEIQAWLEKHNGGGVNLRYALPE